MQDKNELLPGTRTGKDTDMSSKPLQEIRVHIRWMIRRDMPEVLVIGGHDSSGREGLVSIVVEGHPSADVVSLLNQNGVRTHVRKDDYFSGNILVPLNLPTCIRVSMCHYNTREEVVYFLQQLELIIAG